MSRINRFFKYESGWSHSQWQEYCPNMEYRNKEKTEFPDWLPQSLTDKFNSAIVVCSGSNDYSVFVFTGFRVDGAEIDEHQYIAAFDLENDKTCAGFIEHADYDGRTREIPPEMQRLMTLSGITADIKIERKPDLDEGCLEDLKEEGLLSGFINAVSVLNENKE